MVEQASSLTSRILGVQFRGATSLRIRVCGWSQDRLVFRSGESHTEFLVSNSQLFPIYRHHQGCEKLVDPCLILQDGRSKCQQREVIEIGCHVTVRDGTVRRKVVEEGGLDDRFLWDPRPLLMGK